MSDTKQLSPLVEDARELIHRRYPYLMGSGEMAEILQVSAPHLIRQFRQELGSSPTRYLIDYKLEQSKKLLATPQLYVDTVANLVGFSCGNYFAKVFKKAYGLSPTQYMAQIQGQQTPEEDQDFPELYL